VLAHLSCIAVLWTGVIWLAVVICIVLYWLRIFAIGAGYHRYSRNSLGLIGGDQQ
jgi:stearoyl-CoA desaturase (delta-9 desaturase)